MIEVYLSYENFQVIVKYEEVMILHKLYALHS